MKSLLTLILLTLTVFTHDAAKVPATNEQSLEVGNMLLTIQAKTNEARALRAEATLAEQEATKINERVKPLLDKIMLALKLDKEKYVASIEGGQLIFVLKQPEPAPTPKP